MDIKTLIAFLNLIQECVKTAYDIWKDIRKNKTQKKPPETSAQE